MLTFSLMQQFLLSLALGALIGIEREKRKHKEKGKDFTGIRTFMLTTLLGTLSAFISKQYFSSVLPITLVCFIVVMLAGYILSAYFNKDLGMTTELSTIVGFFIGILCFTGPISLAVILAIFTTLILSLKVLIHSYVRKLRIREFYDGLKFLIIAFVILPLLPNQQMGPFDAFNPYEIWLIVVFVSGVSFGGYMLVKFFGTEKGTGLTGILGGFTSTALVTSMAERSKEVSPEQTQPLIYAAVLAASTMFLKVILVVFLLNGALAGSLVLPMAMLSAIGYLPIIFMWRHKDHKITQMNIKTPLSLFPALKFGVFYSIITFVSHLMKFYFGTKGLYIVSMISGLADVDAMTVFVARQGAELLPSVAMTAIVIAAISNTFIKMIISGAFGSKEFRKDVCLILGLIIGAGVLFIIMIGKI